jgi:Ni/Co efflux regulator RcnB
MKIMTGAKIAALALGLGIAASPAYAAPGDWKQRDKPDATQQQDQNEEGDRDRRDNKRRDGKQQNDRTPPSGMNKTDWQKNNNDNDRDRDRDRTRGDRNDRDYNYQNNNDRRNDRDWNRNSRRNININQYRRNFKSPRRYRIGIYHAPRGYYYRRWHYGERLPISFFARDYWLMDYIAFGLFAPPPGYVWVRYGPDALLIDTETGEIVQVRYDVFYS